MAKKKKEVAHAEAQLERFQKMRAEAATPEKLTEANFWVSHWRTVLSNLKQE